RCLRAGFAQPLSNLAAAGAGLSIGAVAIAILWGLARIAAPKSAGAHPASLVITFAVSIISALVIAVIEEGFFRAFLLDGMARDFGRRAGLVASSAVYAAAHLVRSPARFEVDGVHPLVGLRTLAASVGQLAHPIAAAPGLLGLFLLGLLLGTAFLKTARVYFSIGLHASLIVGATAWRKLAPGAQSAPGWLSGYGRPPLISGAAAWLITLALLMAVNRLRLGGDRRTFSEF
ncbi:MAG TPA: CPBP family glutamic-type intramembrane protease, partial [Candidatus Binataceae bacterium]